MWTPDYIGSVCFLVASLLAVRTLSRPPWHAGRPWKVAGLNLLGSVFFMAAAIAAFVLPDTEDLLDASLANSGTFLGAICFLVAARIEITPRGMMATASGRGTIFPDDEKDTHVPTQQERRRRRPRPDLRRPLPRRADPKYRIPEGEMPARPPTRSSTTSWPWTATPP